MRSARKLLRGHPCEMQVPIGQTFEAYRVGRDVGFEQGVQAGRAER